MISIPVSLCNALYVAEYGFIAAVLLPTDIHLSVKRALNAEGGDLT